MFRGGFVSGQSQLLTEDHPVVRLRFIGGFWSIEASEAAASHGTLGAFARPSHASTYLKYFETCKRLIRRSRSGRIPGAPRSSHSSAQTVTAGCAVRTVRRRTVSPRPPPVVRCACLPRPRRTSRALPLTPFCPCRPPRAVRTTRRIGRTDNAPGDRIGRRPGPRVRHQQHAASIAQR